MKKARLLLLILPLIAGALYLRSLASWRPRTLLTGKGPVIHLVFSGDSKTLLVVHLPADSFLGTASALSVPRDFTLIWQRHNDLHLRTRPQFFADDSQILVDGEYEQTLDALAGKTLKNYGRHPERTLISRDGKWLASHNDYNLGLLAIRPVTKGLEFHMQQPLTRAKILGKAKQQIQEVAFSPDGNILVMAVGDYSGGLHLEFYATKTGKRLSTCPDLRAGAHQSSGYTALQWSRDGRYLLSSWYQYKGTRRKTGIHVWRTSDGRKLASALDSDLDFSPRFSGKPLPQLQNDANVAVNKAGQVLLRTGPKLDLAPQPLLHLSNEVITAVTMSPDATYLVAGTRSGRVWWQRVK